MAKKYLSGVQNPASLRRLNFNLLLGYWLPLLAWMAVIFSASSDTRSFQHSSRIIGPLILWAFPSMDEHTLRIWVFAGRKVAHVTEYAILAILVLRALDATSGNKLRRQALLALAFCCLYAASDEFHQKFVPTREASVVDVLIDTAGAAFAIGMYRLRGKPRDKPGPLQR
jgi:VanZ family protein